MQAHSLEAASEVAVMDQIDTTDPSLPEKSGSDPNTVDFEDGDPANPINWQPWRKWIIVTLVSAMNMLG